MKYKVGDIVVIKKDLLPGKMYGDFVINHEGRMNIYCGKIVKIISSETLASNQLKGYKILNCHEFFWTDEMIERFATNEEKEEFLLETIAESL